MTLRYGQIPFYDVLLERTSSVHSMRYGYIYDCVMLRFCVEIQLIYCETE